MTFFSSLNVGSQQDVGGGTTPQVAVDVVRDIFEGRFF